jgi:hypothetical protein
MKIDKVRTYAPEGAVVMSSSFAFCSIGLVGYLREVQCPIDFVFHSPFITYFNKYYNMLNYI